MKYAIKADNTTYVCKGSYVYQGEPFKVIGDLENARLFKSKQSAEKELDRIMGRFSNIDNSCYVVEVDWVT